MVEFRVLQYFLAVVQAGSISGAAAALHLSQPTLSRQLRNLEEELGKPLFLRSNRKITLTDEGRILQKRAEEIQELLEKTQEEIGHAEGEVAGDVRIGAGESERVRLLVQTVQKLRQAHPKVRLHIISGDKTSVLEDLEHGLTDFALVFGSFPESRYESLPLPPVDRFGVMMPKDDPLAEREVLAPEDLWDKPLILSRQLFKEGTLAQQLGCAADRLQIAGTYNLLFNGSLMVEEGMGYALCFDHIVHMTESSRLCFRPLSVTIRPAVSLLWKRHQVFSRAALAFLASMQALSPGGPLPGQGNRN